MSYDIKEFLKKFFSSRLFVLSAVFIAFFTVIILRVFVLQIVNGKSYQENFSLKIQQTQAVNAARGNIYDKNGKLPFIFLISINVLLPPVNFSFIKKSNDHTSHQNSHI